MGSIDLTCPNCGHHEEAMIGPTFSIGGRFDITVKGVKCSKCGYDGPPENDADGGAKQEGDDG